MACGILLTLALALGLMSGMTLTAFAATSYNITINGSQLGSVTASVNGSEVTSAEEGETVTLAATPDNGYRLKNISGETIPSETLTASAKTVNGTYFTVDATYKSLYGWGVQGIVLLRVTIWLDGVTIV